MDVRNWGKLVAKVSFTATRISGFKCPIGKAQAFLWDADTTGLGLRVTPAGQPSYVFQSTYQSRSLRMTLGSPSDWTIKAARAEARRLQTVIDAGRDPRQVKAEITAADVAKREADRLETVTVQEAWDAYLSERHSKWGDRHYADHLAKASPGGEKSVRGTRGRGVTVPGPLFPLMGLRLKDLNSARIESWAASEGRVRPASARLAWRLLRGFLSWCSEQSAYCGVVPERNPAKTKRSREALGRVQSKNDVLQREQLAPWFRAVQQVKNPAISAYLQCLLLVGCRPGELMRLRWTDVNATWRGLTIRDKVEGERVIPLTDQVSRLLHALPRRGEWVFAGANPESPISTPNHQFTRACKLAGISGLTLHGLRRSFKSLTEWLEIPAGVVAQIMGHKPSATAEKHYTVRPLELLRLHHQSIENWILEQAGVGDALTLNAKVVAIADRTSRRARPRKP